MKASVRRSPPQSFLNELTVSTNDRVTSVSANQSQAIELRHCSALTTSTIILYHLSYRNIFQRGPGVLSETKKMVGANFVVMSSWEMILT